MSQFTRVLYIYDIEQDDKFAHIQALSLARNNAASMSIVALAKPLYGEFLRYEEALHTGVLAKAKEQHTACCHALGLDSDMIQTDFSVVSDRDPALAIIQYVIKEKIDLVVKAVEPLDIDRGYSALDMSFLRKCPVPVWLCKPIEKHRDKIKVAVAMDPSDTSSVNHQLNTKLLSIAESLAHDCDGVVNLVSCWNFELEGVLRQSIWLKVAEEDLNEQLNLAEQANQEAIDNLLTDISTPVNIHNVKGEAKHLLPTFVDENNIDILVMGTVARTGIPGLMIGNTAEDVLTKLTCTLMAVKPDGFESPVSQGTP